ncbi:hypothetical protein LTR78_001372 [Recurvomyces mirabilis]|uniref:Fe2OG dioxygenase domain-containing protein n=1 Tax=Recurvomyces mirabilis TaxID=574656 RepID=A0AAE0WW36_9PEZI|nr:hypothetical protein LTR78_001372 [Recurvomyces mirabilis]KAK5161349.1 hypothetical protein LTS14_001145 [Recurvomyces mirabilis]
MPPKSKQAKRSAGATRKDETGLISRVETAVPRWPPLTHLPTAADLTLTSVLSNQILTITGLWTPSLCKTYVSFLSTLPLVTTPGNPKKGEAVRVNDRYQTQDAGFAEQLWSATALRDLVNSPSIDGRLFDESEKTALWGGEVLGLNDNIRIYRYNPGQFFDQHYDDANNVVFTAPGSQSVPAKTTWTLLLYLTSPATGCQGGETVFYPEPTSKRDPTPQPVITELDVGMALLHRHGRDCMLHEGRKVTAGVKWVIRSDLGDSTLIVDPDLGEV